jgi:hypothetical protein
MEEIYYIYATAGLMVLYFLHQVITRRFDPFAPVWLFLLGYLQVYVLQALSYHDWAVEARGLDLVTAANFRSFWALLWFLLVYQLAPARIAAGALPRPPARWSPLLPAVICPPLIVWGLFCANMFVEGDAPTVESFSSEEALFRSFPFMMLVAAVMLVITGRTMQTTRPVFLAFGLLTGAAYVAIWMFNGKRSHSLMGLLATVCGLYLTRLKRPSWPVLITTGVLGALVVTIAIGWRETSNYQRSVAGFAQFLSDFQPDRILVNLNVKDDDDGAAYKSYESVEYGGFLLMLDTVPTKSPYDYGENYVRIFSTFIPRIIWPDKPLFGRSKWIGAWIAGSELERNEEFTGPAIGVLGATQLNGGTVGTLIVLGCLALILRSGYEYLRLYPHVPWVQFCWAITYYNAWFMVVNDDPVVWFYYNWGFTAAPVVVLTWWWNRGPVTVAHQSRDLVQA